MGACSSIYWEWNTDEKWSSQEWKSDDMLESQNGETRGWATVHPAHRQVCHWLRFFGLWHHQRIRPFDKITVILAQGEWSFAKDVGPIFKRCNTKQQQTFFNVGNVYVFNIGSICIHGKELLRKFTFHQKYKEQSHFETDVWHIWKVDSRTIGWDFWRFFMETISYLLVSDEDVISLSHAKVYVFSGSVLCLGKMNQNPESKFAWGEKLFWFKSSSHYRTLDTIDGDPMEFEWNIFQRFTSLRLCNKVQAFMSTNERSIRIKKDGSSSCRHSTTSHGDLKTMKGNAMLTPHFVSFFAKRFPAGRWSFLGPGSEKKWYSIYIDRPHGEWDRVAELMMMIKFGKSGHPVFRATSPLSRGTLKSKVGGKLSIHFCADGIQLKLSFAQYFC